MSLAGGSVGRAGELPPGVCVAPLWRRVVAVLINVAVGIGSLVGVGVAGYKLRGVLESPLRPLATRFGAWREAQQHAEGNSGMSLRARMLFQVEGLVFELDRRNRPGLGARVMRIRRVDLRSGGPISVRSALIGHFVQAAIGAALAALARPLTKRAYERVQALQPQIKELQRSHAEDKAAQQEALMRFFREQNVSPLRSCGPAMLPMLAPIMAVLFSRRHQTVPDRLAGIVWIINTGPRSES